ncbi:MAG: hypothetical protein CSA76_03845 [Spirochaetales bacterium]|nr:MAG: hypothetical protein CSA76_03845 [Spirochaetales bacterium]
MKKLLLIILLTAAAAAVFAGEAILISFSGTVEIQEPGGEWKAAEAGQFVSSRSMISTGFGSRARLKAGGMMLQLQPLTRVSISSLVQKGNTASTQVSLQSGRVRASRPPVTRAKRRSIDFRVSTPVATAAVRGTDFEMGANNRLVTNEGIVEFSNEELRVFSYGGTSVWAKELDGFIRPASSAWEIWSVSPVAGSFSREFSSFSSSALENLGIVRVDLE